MGGGVGDRDYEDILPRHNSQASALTGREDFRHDEERRIIRLIRERPAKVVGNHTKAGLTIQPVRKVKQLLLSAPSSRVCPSTVKQFPPTLLTTQNSMIAMQNTTSIVKDSSAPIIVTGWRGCSCFVF